MSAQPIEALGLTTREIAMSVVSARDDGLWQFMTSPGARGTGLMVWVSDMDPHVSYYNSRTAEQTDGEPWVTPALVWWESFYDENGDEAEVDLETQYPRTHVPFVTVTTACFLDASPDNWWPGTMQHNLIQVSGDQERMEWEVCGGFLAPVWSIIPISEDFAYYWATELVTAWKQIDVLHMTGEAFSEEHETYDENGDYVPDLCDDLCKCGLEYAITAVHNLTQTCPDFTMHIESHQAEFASSWQYALDRWATGWHTIQRHSEETDCCSRYSRAYSPFSDSDSFRRCHPAHGPQFRIS